MISMIYMDPTSINHIYSLQQHVPQENKQRFKGIQLCRIKTKVHCTISKLIKTLARRGLKQEWTRPGKLPTSNRKHQKRIIKNII